jgi:serine/threonine protein kinase/predicted ATPase
MKKVERRRLDKEQEQVMRIGDRYDLGEQIGAGGMGTVYRGEDTLTGLGVAIKSLKPDAILADPNMVMRFMREATALRQLNHPNIVKVIDSLEHQGIHYIVMEYMSGGSLRDVLDEVKLLPVERALQIMLDLADALTRAHRLEIIHRDLKPANVLIADDDTPRLTDFGVAHLGQEERVTKTGMAIGTLDYISPEAFNGEVVDKRADIWAFGVMLFEMVIGKKPFLGSSVSNVIKAVLTDPVPDLETLRPDLPIALVDLIYRMLERDPHARIPSVRLIGAELEAIIQGRDTGTIQRVAPPDSEGRFVGNTVEIAPKSPEAIIVPHNLPNQPTPFVGRKNELGAIQGLFDDPDVRLITLLGPGGMGKTRIALEAARLNLQRFEDGAYFVPLAPLENVDLLVSTIADHINFTFAGADGHQGQLVNYLSEKTLLLVLDNFEHLLDGVDVIAEILQHAPFVQIMVTSRALLRLRNEHSYEITGMILPEDTVSIDQLQEYPAIKLFLQSAHRVMPDFVVDEHSAPHVVQIIGQVQGLPLGIELAAAWLEMLSGEEIVAEINQSLDFLETDLRDVPERHRSIRAVFEYSWNLMQETERDSFMKLTIFRGGFEREAAQSVAGAGLRTLNSLINKSLLTRDPTGRYRLHTLLRQYAEEHFANHADSESVHEAHAMYYGRFLEKVQSMYNTRNEEKAADMVEIELENARLAWNWAIQNQRWEPLSKSLYTMLMFHIGRSMSREGAAMFDTLAQALITHGQSDTAIYWQTRSHQAWVSNSLGDYELVWQYASGAYDFFQKTSNGWAMSEALNTMSYVKMMQGDYDASVDYASKAIEHSNQPDVPPISWFMGMGNKGYAEFLRGNDEEARRIYEEIIERSKTVDYSPPGNAYMINNLGEIVRAMGENDQAREMFNRAYKIFEQHKLRRGMAFTLNNLAGIEFQSGNNVRAKAFYLRAYELNKEIGDQWGIGHSLAALGNTAMFSSNFAEARQYFEQSLKIRRDMGDQKSAAESLLDLGRVAAIEGDYDAAKKCSEEGLIIYREIGDKFGTVSALLGIGVSLIGLNQPNEAMIFVEEAHELGHGLQRDFIHERITATSGEICLMKGNYDKAEIFFNELVEVGMKTLASKQIMAVALSGFAEIMAQRDKNELALELITLSMHCIGEFTLFAPHIEKRKQALLKRLSEELPETTVRDINERSMSQDVLKLAEGLLKQVRLSA